MDTLLEANKHASLMRRRDQPKQFPASHLQCNSAVAPRSFGALAAPVARPVMRPVPAACGPAKVKMNAEQAGFVALRAAGSLRGPRAAQPRLAPRLRRRSTSRVAAPAHSIRMPVALTQAEATPIRFRSPIGAGVRRSFVMLAQRPRATVIPERGFRTLDLEPVGKIAVKRERSVKFAAKVGNAFRVSGKRGFRPQTMIATKVSLRGPEVGAIRWPQAVPLPGAAYIGRAIVPHPEEQDLPIAAVRLPAARKPVNTSGIKAAGTMTLPASPPREISANAKPAGWRSLAVDGQQVVRQSGLRAGQSPVKPNCIALKLVPAGAAANHRVGRAPFEPQDQAMINLSYSWNASR